MQESDGFIVGFYKTFRELVAIFNSKNWIGGTAS